MEDGNQSFRGSTFYRRDLPHLRRDCSTYFVTWRLCEGLQLLSEEERDIIAEGLFFFNGRRYAIIAQVVMDDHVHVIVHPFSPHMLSSVLHAWKSYTAHRIASLRQSPGQVWQNESWDRLIRDDEELLSFAHYIANNPRKR